jgi:hypothetical protein
MASAIMFYEAENQFRNKLLYADSQPSFFNELRPQQLLHPVDFLNVEGTRRTGSTWKLRVNSSEGTEGNADRHWSSR